MRQAGFILSILIALFVLVMACEESITDSPGDLNITETDTVATPQQIVLVSGVTNSSKDGTILTYAIDVQVYGNPMPVIQSLSVEGITYTTAINGLNIHNPAKWYLRLDSHADIDSTVNIAVTTDQGTVSYTMDIPYTPTIEPDTLSNKQGSLGIPVTLSGGERYTLRYTIRYALGSPWYTSDAVHKYDIYAEERYGYSGAPSYVPATTTQYPLPDSLAGKEGWMDVIVYAESGSNTRLPHSAGNMTGDGVGYLCWGAGNQYAEFSATASHKGYFTFGERSYAVSIEDNQLPKPVYSTPEPMINRMIEAFVPAHLR